MAKITPLVRDKLLAYNDNSIIPVDSPAWWLWLHAPATSNFRFEQGRMSFTARREQKGGGFYWYAYRKQQGRLRKIYLGRGEELTWERMENAARALSHVERERGEASAPEPTPTQQVERAAAITSAPLLTKLSLPPARHELVARPRLYTRLDQALTRKLTLISAPAGFGKTTLVSAWRTSRQDAPPLAWLALDEGDNDPARFWNYMVAALQSIHPGLGAHLATLLQLAPTQWPPMEAILTVLINALTNLPHDVVLALDDYHLISTQAIHESMAFLLEHQPPHLHLILLSRVEPALPLGRLRARGELCELQCADLRFTSEEIALFLTTVMGLHLATPEIALLGERTEGWVAGLQLAALSLQGQPNPAGLIARFTGSHQHIVEYLSTEVLARQSAAQQDFLLSTSLLERLNASLCDAVTRRRDSQELLARLEQDNLFLIPLDEERHWYRYHHLFAEFLRTHLARQNPSLIPQLQQRAIAWYEAHGFMSEAIEHALRIEDFSLAGRMIAQTGAEMIKCGELMTLLSWLTRCPDELVRANPRLSLYAAGALGSIGQLEGAELHISNAQLALQKVQEANDLESVSAVDLQQIKCELGAIRTFVVSARADVQGTIEVAQETLKLLPAEDAFVRSLISASLGQAYLLAGDIPRAREVFRETRIYSEAAHNITALIVSVTCEGYMLTFQGKPHAAEEIFQQALGLAREISEERLVPALSLTYIGLGALYYDWNNVERASEYLRRGIELGQNWGFLLMLSQGYALLALTLHVTGHAAECMALFDEAEQLMRQYHCPKGLSWLQSARARIWLMQGNLEAAPGWVQASGFSVDDPLTYMTEYEHISLARVLLAQGNYPTALRFLQRLVAHAESEERYQDVMIMLILQALVLARQGEREQALGTLEQALRLGEPAGSIRPFIDEGRPMLELLKFALTRGVAPDYVRRLLASFSESAQVQAQESSDLFLSERERDVLRLLAAGQSNQQIADAFVVARSTVKTHLNNIYLKLGVHSRTQAIVRAKELHLL